MELKTLPKDKIGKWVIASPYGTHAPVMVVKEEYQGKFFDSEAEAIEYRDKNITSDPLYKKYYSPTKVEEKFPYILV